MAPKIKKTLEEEELESNSDSEDLEEFDEKSLEVSEDEEDKDDLVEEETGW